MDINSLFAALSIACYGYLAFRHWGDANAQAGSNKDHIIALLAIAMHWWITIDKTIVDQGYILSFANTGSIVAVFIASLRVFVSSAIKRLEKMLCEETVFGFLIPTCELIAFRSGDDHHIIARFFRGLYCYR